MATVGLVSVKSLNNFTYLTLSHSISFFIPTLIPNQLSREQEL